MPKLKNNLTLKDIQDYVIKFEKEKGFEKQTVMDKALMLGEEVGELFKAIRKEQKIKIDENSNFKSIDGELADIIIYLCCIANRFEIDLEEAFRYKDEVNKNRSWK